MRLPSGLPVAPRARLRQPKPPSYCDEMDIDHIAQLVTEDSGLATISVARADGTVHSSVVNAGVIEHPITGAPAVAAVARGSSWKLRRLREHPHATLVFRVGWSWASADGPVDIFGPDDTADGFDPNDIPELLRNVYRAAGGTHDDWNEYDRVMAAERRTAIFVSPHRILGVG